MTVHVLRHKAYKQGSRSCLHISCLFIARKYMYYQRYIYQYISGITGEQMINLVRCWFSIVINKWENSMNISQTCFSLLILKEFINLQKRSICEHRCGEKNQTNFILQKLSVCMHYSCYS